MEQSHKQAWCDAFPVRMRLAGWDTPACDAAHQYVNQVRRIYTGRAWRIYTLECERFLREKTTTSPQTMVAYFPRRSNVGRTLNLMA